MKAELSFATSGLCTSRKTAEGTSHLTIQIKFSRSPNFILNEDIPLFLNSKLKQNVSKLESKHNNGVQILVFYCGNMFRSC